MDDKLLLLMWGESEAWVYGGDYEGSARVFFSGKRLGFERVVIGIHPSAMQLVCVDVVGNLAKQHLKRHMHRSLAQRLDRQAKGQQCFAVGAAELPGGLSKHWVAACDGAALLKCWEWLYRRLGKKPEIVMPLLGLKRVWEACLGCRYQHAVILHQENAESRVLVYQYDQLAYCQTLHKEEDWGLFRHEMELPDQLLVMKRPGFDINSLDWPGAIEVVESEGQERHSAFLRSAAWGGGER